MDSARRKKFDEKLMVAYASRFSQKECIAERAVSTTAEFHFNMKATLKDRTVMEGGIPDRIKNISRSLQD